MKSNRVKMFSRKSNRRESKPYPVQGVSRNRKKINRSGKKSNAVVTKTLRNKSVGPRGRGRFSKLPKMTVTEVKVGRSRRGKHVRNPEEANQIEQVVSGLLQENVSQAVQVVSVAIMKMDGIIPPKNQGRPPKMSYDFQILDSRIGSPHGNRKKQNVIVKPELTDQTEAETTTPKRRGRPLKVVSSPSPGPPPKAVKSPTPKKGGRPLEVPSSPTPKRKRRPSKVVSSTAHLDGATGDDDSNSDDDNDDRFESRFGFSSSSSHNLAKVAKIVKNVLGTSVRKTERNANMEEHDDKDSEMGGKILKNEKRGNLKM